MHSERQNESETDRAKKDFFGNRDDEQNLTLDSSLEDAALQN
jgi:hypothetical protein